MHLMEGDNVNFAACSELEGASGNTVDIGLLRVCSSLCLRTTADRWAKLVVTAGRSGKSPSGQEVDFDITVWDT
jgi:hypothetical protein